MIIMHKIIADLFEGFYHSLRIDLLFKECHKSWRLSKLIGKIVTWNFIFYIAPTLLDIYHNITVINVFTAIMNLLYFTELVTIMKSCIAVKKSNTFIIDTITTNLTMFIYQLVIYTTTRLIDAIISSFTATLIKFYVLTVYHSLYCFGNLWQHKKLGILKIVDIHERQWPYYLGYSIIASVLYLNIHHPICHFIYNCNIILTIAIPFIMPVKYPSGGYVAIHLGVFSYMIEWLIIIAKTIINPKQHRLMYKQH